MRDTRGTSIWTAAALFTRLKTHDNPQSGFQLQGAFGDNRVGHPGGTA